MPRVPMAGLKSRRVIDHGATFCLNCFLRLADDGWAPRGKGQIECCKRPRRQKRTHEVGDEVGRRER